MKILFAADGSKYTKKALAFLAVHDLARNPDNELLVLNVQPLLPPRVASQLGAGAVAAYHREEAQKVLAPIKTYLTRQKIAFEESYRVGRIAEEIVKMAEEEKVHMIVMGTHGHGLLARAALGSIAQRVVTQAEIPVLLVR